MFRAAHRSSSGALNCICSHWFICCNKVKDFVYIIHSPYYNITIVFQNKEYYCNIIIWTMYNIYESFTLLLHINQRLQMQFRAPDDERCAA